MDRVMPSPVDIFKRLLSLIKERKDGALEMAQLVESPYVLLL